MLEIWGSASGDPFNGWELRYGVGAAPGQWIRIGEAGESPVENGQLTAIDSSQLEDGVYALRLTVRREGETEDVVYRRFRVDNTPPTVAVTSVVDGETVLPGPLLIEAEVVDAGGLESVEFRIDGQNIGVVRRAPFAIAWTAVPGEHVLEVVVFDRAGNTTTSLPIRLSVP